MTVKVHTTEPVPPAKTYDLLGLTPQQVIYLLNLLGAQTVNPPEKLYEALLRGSGAIYTCDSKKGHVWLS